MGTTEPGRVLGDEARRLGPSTHDLTRERRFERLGSGRRYPSLRPSSPKT